MSRSDKSTNNFNENPATRFFQWSSKHQTLVYYDKSIQDEDERNIKVALPFTFLVLDQLVTVTGFNKALNEGYWSNEVRGAKDELIVKSKKQGIVKTGEWKADIKDAVPSAKYTKSVYIAFHDDAGVLQIGNIKFAGAALSGLSEKAIAENLKAFKKDKKAELYDDELFPRVGWMNFCENNRDIEDIAVQLTHSVWDKNGTVEFYRPVFRRYEAVKPETTQRAMELDKELQIYLKKYLAQNKNTYAETDDEEGEFPSHSGGNQKEDDFYKANPDNLSTDIPDFSSESEENQIPDFNSDGEVATGAQVDAIIKLLGIYSPTADLTRVALHYSNKRTDMLEELTQAEAATAIAQIPTLPKK